MARVSSGGSSYDNKVVSFRNPQTGERRFGLENSYWQPYINAGFTQNEGIVQPDSPYYAEAVKQTGVNDPSYYGGGINLSQSNAPVLGPANTPSASVMPGAQAPNAIPGQSTQPGQSIQPQRTIQVSAGEPINADELMQVRRGNEGIIQVSRYNFDKYYQPAGFQAVGQTASQQPSAPSSSPASPANWQSQFSSAYSNTPPTYGQAPASDNAAGLTGIYGELYGQLKQYLDRLHANGQVINPAVTITPEQVARFTSQAQNEINPYYAGHLAAARDSFMKSINESVGTLNQNETNLERRYGIESRNLAQSMADRGFALSGQRQTDERNLATDTQNQINTGRRNLEFTAGNEAGNFARQYGSDSLYNPMMSSAPTVTPGETSFSRAPTSRSLYQLSPDVYNGLIGSEEYARREAVANRTSQLEGNANSQSALNQERALTF